MLLFSLNLVITLVWIGLSQDFSFLNLLLGYSVGFGLLYVASAFFDDRRYFLKCYQLIRFILFYLYELLKSNIEVAWDVLTPKDLSRPGIIRIPVSLDSDFQIALLMNLITFTPGSLSMDLSQDKKFLYVHGMFVRDVEEYRKTIIEDFEAQIRNLFG